MDSFFTSPTTPEEIINIVSSLKSSNSEGVDYININVIKTSIDLLASPSCPFLLVLCLIDSKSVVKSEEQH